MLVALHLRAHTSIYRSSKHASCAIAPKERDAQTITDNIFFIYSLECFESRLWSLPRPFYLNNVAKLINSDKFCGFLSNFVAEFENY
jgi:hypothetical protein